MNRSEMRRCGKRYAGAAEVLRSKAGQAAGVMIHASAGIEDDCGTTRCPACDGRWAREPMGAAA